MSKSKQEWPAWFYGPKGESNIFQNKDEVPKGWKSHPSEFKDAPKTKPDTTSEKHPATNTVPAANVANQAPPPPPPPTDTAPKVDELEGRAKEIYDENTAAGLRELCKEREIDSEGLNKAQMAVKLTEKEQAGDNS